MTTSRLPRATVVIPLFQKGPYIRRALESVLRQSVREIEIIVIDDGSTDEGPSLAEAVHDDRLIVHRHGHEGVSAARNRGVQMARADWIAFLDADDEWLPGFLESTLAIAETTQGLAAVFARFRDYQTGRLSPSDVSCEGLVVRDYFQTLLQNRGIGMFSSSVLVSKRFFLACGGFAEAVDHGEDLDLWAKLAWSGPIAYSAQVGAVWHTEVPDSASKNVRAAIASVPACHVSYQQWLATGRIPVELRPSSRRYANWLLAQHAMELAHQGLPEAGRRLLALVAWSDRSDLVYLRAMAWSWLPTRFLRLGRRFGEGLRSRRRGPG